MKLHLHRDDLPAIVFIASLLIILIVVVLTLVLWRENVLELQVGEVVNYKNLLDDFSPRDKRILRLFLIEGVLFTLLISFTIGWVVRSRRSIVTARLGFALCLVSCGLLLILLDKTLDLSTYDSDELRHLANSEFEGKIYTLAGEADFDGNHFTQYDTYWLFECDNVGSRCTVIHSQPEQLEFLFADPTNKLVHDISNNSLKVIVQGEIVYTIPAEDE
jgi:hypothetical protein